MDLTVMMEQRFAEYQRMATTLAPLIASSPRPALVVADLLMQAYRDGGRDMHAAVMETFDALGQKP